MYWRTTDSERWGPGEEVRLANWKVDRNFWEIYSALQNLILNPPQPNNILSIERDGAGLTFVFADGTRMGPVPIQVLMYRDRGAWLPNTVYYPLDLFIVDGAGVYAAKVEFNSGIIFDENLLIDGELAIHKIIGYGYVPGGGLADDGDILLFDATAQRWTARRPIIELQVYGPSFGADYSSAQPIFFYKATRGITFLADGAGYLGIDQVAGAGALPAANADFAVSKALAATPTTFNAVETITLNTDGTVVFDSSSVDVVLAAGDVLKIEAPSSVDSSLRDFYCTLVGYAT